MLKGYVNVIEGYIICEECAEDIGEIHELKETKDKKKCVDCKEIINK